MRLYHSFPRFAVKERDLAGIIAAGLATLQTIIEFGIVLTPEDLYVPPNPRAANEAPAHTIFAQERACFTLLQREELFRPIPESGGRTTGKSHADRFGSFAIGLDPIRARTLGAVPVIYFYGTEKVENISFEILFRIRELRTLMTCLSHIEAKAAIPNRDVLNRKVLGELGFDLADEPKIAERIDHVTESTARSIADLVDTDRVAAWNLVDWIDILLNFFQTADSKSTPDSLIYYQQREWRIVKLFGEHVQCYPLALARYVNRRLSFPISECRALRARLKAVDPRFFTEERLDGSSVMLGARREPFFEFVEELIVPMRAVPETEMLLKFYKLGNTFSQSTVFSQWVSFERIQERRS